MLMQLSKSKRVHNTVLAACVFVNVYVCVCIGGGGALTTSLNNTNLSSMSDIVQNIGGFILGNALHSGP